MKYLEELKKSLKCPSSDVIHRVSYSLSETYCRIANIEQTYTENEAGFFSGSSYRTCFISDILSTEKDWGFKFHFTVFGETVDDHKSFYAPVQFQAQENGTYIVRVPGFPERISKLNGRDDALINDIIEYAAKGIPSEHQ